MFFSFLQVKESGDIFDLQLLIYRTKGAYRKSLALGTIGFTQRPRGGQPEAGFPVLQGVRPFHGGRCPEGLRNRRQAVVVTAVGVVAAGADSCFSPR